MAESDMKTFTGLLREFEHAMLVTRRGSELRSRPMRIGDTTSDGRIRFVTRDDSAKLGELDEDDRVNVSMQGDSRFLSISGHARLSKDRDLIESAWSPDQAVWFLEGRDDPRVIVLEVIPTHAEYWDRSESDVLSLALDRLRSAVGDEASGDADEEHADIDFKDKAP